MKKTMNVIITIVALLAAMVSCVPAGDSDVVGAFEGEADIRIFSDADLKQEHQGKCETANTYYVAVDVEIEKILGVVVDKTSSTLSVEFSNSDAVIVSYTNGASMEAYTSDGRTAYSCKIYSEANYDFVFAFYSTTDEAFDIKIYIDQKLIGSKIVDF